MNTRHAFTLVEVLTVIVIISILAALVTVAVAGAMRAGHRARIAVQMNHVAMGLEHYKAEFGEYPPDMFDYETLVRHVKKRWPRLDWSKMPQIPSGHPRPNGWGAMTPAEQTIWEEAWSIKSAIDQAYGGHNVGFSREDFDNPYPSRPPLGALVLWLGGFPNADGKFSGFGADPANPFTISNGAYDKRVFIDMELGKSVHLIDHGSWTIPVIGNEVRGTFVPIVYFRGRADGGNGAYRVSGVTSRTYKLDRLEVKQFRFANSSEPNWCVPYAEEEHSVGIKWKNPTTYQLLHPGLDGIFGIEGWDRSDTGPVPNQGRRFIKTGTGIGLQDLDNLTNFSDYKELKSILP